MPKRILISTLKTFRAVETRLCLYHTKLRSVTRRLYNIKPNVGLDCMTTLCCSTCALQQGGQYGPGGSAPVYNYELPFDEMTIAGSEVKMYSEIQQMRLNIDAFGNGPWNNAKLAPTSRKTVLKPVPVSQQLLIQDFTKSYTYDFAPYIEIEPPPDCFPGKDFTTVIPY
ncbi:hypothetical protein GUITHDRAFT_139267 [Guillardia theta CCMP2712]|uniref:Uncharacterized protein n=1 Tax=Guillardia theta (strain CCMP2712) TaxID=905079 RepID=L1J8V2_GUITC|nr:hypothetical protein GUITHDRAFT_139267 [Guillardia theta CCMP2712]EKX44978.1 hypothetical protein GUITHDRAFT_139267 [Guillardia theta CCMP2712]|eukprot:XP_005831958.1 hypothetical protein GUITHDRAFT_139267 [Guillardia theta CCMP2712]